MAKLSKSPIPTILIATGLVIFIFTVVMTTRQPGAYVDLISNQNWSQLSGATQDSDGVTIKPLGVEVMHPDTSPSQPSPPVNVLGPHIKVDGDFVIEAKMSGMEDRATLHFYSQVPVIFDEWRYEWPSMSVDVTGNEVLAQIWDGSGPRPIDQRRYKIDSDEVTDLKISHKDSELSFKVNGKSLDSMPDHSIFIAGEVWFGADAGLGGNGWKLLSLKAKEINDGTVELISPAELTVDINDPESLRNLAATHPRKLPIGTAVSLYPLATDENYRNIVIGQFSSITPENSMKAQFIHPQKNVYSFEDSDALVDMAEKNNMLVHGHSLVFGKANPKWMFDTPEEERATVIEEHIKNVVGRYAGRVQSWDVVNEAIAEDDVDYVNGNLGVRQNMWADAIGEKYIDIAFRAARKADQKAKLYLNDFGLQDPERWDAMVALVRRLQARGVPIDGVGFQSHVYYETDYLDLPFLKEQFQTLDKLGLDVRISEIDITGDGTDPKAQERQYAGALSVCLSQPNCTSYTTWGVSDKYGSTTLSDRYPQLSGENLIFDIDMKPKPAYFNLQDVLQRK